MRVLLITEANGVSEFYRAVTPFRMLEEAGYISLTISSGYNPATADKVNVTKFDCIVFIRADAATHHALVLHAKEHGVRTVFDVDDNLLLLPLSIPCYRIWHDPGTGYQTPRLWYFKRNLALADVLTVTTDTLGRQLCNGEPDSLREKGDYMVLPNQILSEAWDVPVAPKPPGDIWVGWWGIYNHWDDWRDVAPYIEPVILKYPRVKLMILGMPETKQIFRELVKTGQLVTFPFIGPEKLGEYRSIIKAFDMALAPTSDCPFNEGKSDLKMLQYGAAGVPVIASRVTYGDWEYYADLYDYAHQWTFDLDKYLDALTDQYADGGYLVEAQNKAKSLHQKVLSERTYEVNYKKWLRPLGLKEDGTHSGLHN